MGIHIYFIFYQNFVYEQINGKINSSKARYNSVTGLFLFYLKTQTLKYAEP